MDKILTIISLTYKEAIRKRIFLIVIIFTALLVISSALFPVVGAEGRVKLVEIWIIRGISLFGMMLAIFLSAVSIPGDIEAKRMYLLLTKPISKETFLIGKFIGFCFIIALFIAVIGLIGVIYLNFIDLISSDNISSISHPVSVIKASKFSFIQQQKQSKATIEGQYLSDTSGEKSWSGLEIPWQGMQVSLKGEDNNFVAWSFEHLDKNNLPDPVRLKIIGKISEGQYKISSDIELYVRNQVTKAETVKRLTLVYEKPLIVEIDKSYIDDLGRVQFTIRRFNPESQLVVTPESLIILSAPGSFTWNFIKCCLVIFLQIILVLGLVMAASTVLSGPVNIFFGLFLFFCGNAMAFFRESLEAMNQAIRIIQESVVAGKAIPAGADIMPLWVMQISDSISRVMFNILPDLGKYDGVSFLLAGKTVPTEIMSGSFTYMTGYILIALVIGWIGFRSRDFN
jgi:ABC-type transport system involved in multi-copper enzyme maturation permease subunit